MSEAAIQRENPYRIEGSAMINARNAHPYEHIVSVSGGKDSTALYLLAMERGRPFRAVFADTGNEHPLTYDFVRDLPGITGGPPIEWVKADFTRRFEVRRINLQRFWEKDGIPQATIDRARALLVPTGNPFLDLCMLKGRFPSSGRRFCTEELKVQPIIDQVYQPLADIGRIAISWQGVRAEESLARSFLTKWQRVNQGTGRVYAYRPLLEWKLADVWAMHERHGVARNRLYDTGMGRVGCMPCIMCTKEELRIIADIFPEHVERIAEWEAIVGEVAKRGRSSFFAADKIPGPHTSDTSLPMPGVHEVAKWARTSRGGRQFVMRLDPVAEFNTACSTWGACE